MKPQVKPIRALCEAQRNQKIAWDLAPVS